MRATHITSLTSQKTHWLTERGLVPGVTEPLSRSTFKVAGPLSHQPTSDFPEICGPGGGREHHQAVRALRRTTQPAGLGQRGEGSLTSSFCRVFLSSSILCCICFMVCDQSPTPTKSHPLNARFTISKVPRTTAQTENPLGPHTPVRCPCLVS